MTNDARTADEIESDIAEERAQLSGSINDLQTKFSVETIGRDLGDMFRDQGGEIGRAISRTVGRNPTAVALIGVGLAWLWLGQGRKDHDHVGSRHAGRRLGLDGNQNRPAADQWDKIAVAQGPAHSKFPSHDGDRFWFDEAATISAPHLDHGQNATGDAGGSASAAGTLGGMIESVRDTAGAVAEVVSGAAGTVRDTAIDLTGRLSHGTEGLSAEARARVLAARQAALDARVATEAAMQRGRQAATNFLEDQPLVVGALAVAFGAAIGGALPRSQIEDDALGDSSDRLFAEAQAVFRDERNKALAVLKAAADEAKDQIQNTKSDLGALLPDGKSAGDVIVDHLSHATDRVIDSAKDEADRQGLGRREP